jgi:hypothetical protein
MDQPDREGETTMETRFPVEISVDRIIDHDPDYSYLDPIENRDRLNGLYEGNWHYIGIMARAVVTINGTIQTIRSGGLWGIESDSGEDYLTSVENEEKEALIDILSTLGIVA